MKDSLRLKGFIVSLRLPSDRAMMMKVDTSPLKGMSYLSFLKDVKTLMGRIDYNHAERKATLRGRELVAHYQTYRRSCEKRAGYEVIDQKTLLMRPFPSRFENVYKTIRADAYELLNSLTVSVIKEARGRFKDKLYILPEDEDTINKLFAGVNKFNKRLKDLSSMMSSYETGEEMKSVLKLLEEHGVNIIAPYNKDLELSVDLLPIDVDAALDEWASRNPDVARALSAKKREIVQAIADEIKRRVEPILRHLEGELKLKNAEKALSELVDLANTLGLNSMVREVLNPLMEAIKNPERTTELIGKPKDVREGIDARLKSMLEVI